jgi:YggT family protein
MGSVGAVLASVISLVFGIMIWAIIIRVLLSWLPMAGVRIDPYNPIIRALFAITDPILEPLRRYTTVGMMDLSPIVAIVILNVVRQLLISLLTGL